MAEDHIRYDILAQEALRGVVRKVLAEVAKTGLPGEHHFFISFVTRAPGVRLSQRLLEQYDKEMTIVLQNQFWDLKVTDVGFEVGLSFDGHPETLVVPFAAIKGFFDPSVQFGLQFDPAATPDAVAESTAAAAHPAPAAVADETAAAAEAPGEKVVSLDSFRKKT
ncbi:MAG: SspB family protein [Reyranella sp.]